MNNNDMQVRESELLIPSLRIIHENPGINTTNLMRQLETAVILYPRDKEILVGRNDTYFSQTVRNLCGSHIETNEFGRCVTINKETKPSSFTINETGITRLEADERETLNEIIDAEEEQLAIDTSTVYENEVDLENANNRLPESVESSGRTKWKTNPKISKTVIKNSNYKCLYAELVGEVHFTFLTKGGNNYIEGHHFIPMAAQSDYKDINIDREENIVALCPICHKSVHYGNKEEKERRLKVIYNSKMPLLNEQGIIITFEDLLNKYYK